MTSAPTKLRAPLTATTRRSGSASWTFRSDMARQI